MNWSKKRKKAKTMNDQIDRNRRIEDFARGAFFGCCLAAGVYLATSAALKPEATPGFWILWTMSAVSFLCALFAYLHQMRELKA